MAAEAGEGRAGGRVRAVRGRGGDRCRQPADDGGAAAGRRVPASGLIGTRGEGFEIARWAFDGSGIGIAAQAIGIGQVAFDEARAHAKRRHTFGKPIATYEAIQFMLADSATELDAARMLTLKAAATKDEGSRCAVEAAMAKLYASEAAVRTAEIYPGTSEVQRMLISGAVLRKQAIPDPVKRRPDTPAPRSSA